MSVGVFGVPYTGIAGVAVGVTPILLDLAGPGHTMEGLLKDPIEYAGVYIVFGAAAIVLGYITAGLFGWLIIALGAIDIINGIAGAVGKAFL